MPAAYPDLEKLIVCRDLLAVPILQALQQFLQSQAPGPCSRLAACLLEEAERLGLSGNLLPACLTAQLAFGTNLAARTLARSGTCKRGMEQALAADMSLLLPYLQADTASLTGIPFLSEYVPAAAGLGQAEKDLQKELSRAASPQTAAERLLSYYKRYGSGPLARFAAYRLVDGKLQGIANFPHYDWHDLIAYQRQKEKLLANTEAFLSGCPANNVLLTGARGTGKSTAVKALISLFAGKGLRLVQLTREQLVFLPQVLDELAHNKTLKFILFFDDLSFSEEERDYKYLKSAIDGSAVPQPDNVLIYVTSNRRHLLQESWQDRRDGISEIYQEDSANESLSLADRFGLILHYARPTQAEYLAIIEHELNKEGISLPPEELRILGLRWEQEHSGRNGRIAHQFVLWYLGRKKRHDTSSVTE